MPNCNICGNIGAVTRANGESYCIACYNRQYAICDGCGGEFKRSFTSLYETEFRQIFCPTCYDRRFFICDSCSETQPIIRRHHSPDGNEICLECFEQNYVYCSNCETIVYIDDAHYQNDNAYCDCCYRPCGEWDIGHFEENNPQYTRIISKRKFGVEIETSQCPRHHELKDATIWGCKQDYSIAGMEFISPILFGDSGLREIEQFCNRLSRRGFTVDSSCGLHIHFDMQEESDEALKAIAYAYRLTYPLWTKFVIPHRAENRYCSEPNYHAEDIRNEDWDYFVGKRDRFEFVNWRAYLVHGSFEVRLYQGTLDAFQICNWILLHLAFIDFVKCLTLDEIEKLFAGNFRQQYIALGTIIGTDLMAFWTHQAISHYGQFVFTKEEVINA